MRGYKNLLFVKNETDYRVAVSAPMDTPVEVGDLVEYIIPEHFILEPIELVHETTKLGMVVKAVICDPYDDTWNCLTEVGPIYPLKAVYTCTWSKPDETVESILGEESFET